MVLENHAECKTAILGLLDALARIKALSEPGDEPARRVAAIQHVAAEAFERHSPILPRL